MTILDGLSAWLSDLKAEFILNFIDKNRWEMLVQGLQTTLLIALTGTLMEIS